MTSSSKGQPRRRLSDEDWAALVDYYRKNPADHAGAAKVIKASGVTVRRCWEFGQKHVPGRPPIQQIVTRENFEMRAELADLRRTQEADKKTGKKADAEETAVKAQQQVTLRNMRAVGNAGVLVSGKLMGAAMELARSISEDIADPRKTITLKDRVKYMGDLAKFSKTMAEYVQITEKLQRDFDGAPDLTVATVELGAERALELIVQSQRTAKRLKERISTNDDDDKQQAALTEAANAIDADVLSVKKLRGVVDTSEDNDLDVTEDDYVGDDEDLDDQLLEAGEAVLGDIGGYTQTNTHRPGPHARRVNLGSSSNLTDAHYDEQTKMLWVTFNSGKVYRYREVSHECIDDWESAPHTGLSYGQYFIRKIKDNYVCEQV